MQYHVDGDLVDADEATVSVRDRGFLYGDAAFETLRAYGGQVFAWRKHADRLAETCDALGIDHGIADADLRERVRETLAANDLSNAYVRLSITRGVQPGKLSPGPATDPTVVIIVKELPRGGVNGLPVWDGAATIETVDVERVPGTAIPAAAKTHNYLNGILARVDAGADADEALMCTRDGEVTEGATSNLFFVEDGRLHTPTLDLPVLPGVTRWAVFRLADDLGIPVETGRYSPEDVRDADEVFLTNTTWEVRPVSRVDDVTFDHGHLTSRLVQAFDRRIESQHY